MPQQKTPESGANKPPKKLSLIEAARARDTEQSQEAETPEDKKPFLEMAREQIGSAIEALKAKVEEAFQKEKEGTEYNLVVAKVLAENAAKNLGEKLKYVDSTNAYVAIVLGLIALIYSGGSIPAIESNITEAGDFGLGIKSYLDSYESMQGLLPVITAATAATSALFMKLTVDSYRANKNRHESNLPQGKKLAQQRK